MAIKKLSSSFSGSSTRTLNGLNREVESRMRTKRLDVFTDDFSPPGTAESSPGQDYTKRDAPYYKPHDDFDPVADPQFWDKTKVGPWARQLPDQHMKKLGFTGDPKDQEKLDWLDNMVYQEEAPIKNPYDQFPGTIDMEDHKEDVAGFDDHLTDPARLKKMAPYESKAQQGYMHWAHPEIAKKWDKEDKGNAGLPEHVAKTSAPKRMTSSDGPETFHKEVEKRMKRLAIESHPEPQKFESRYQKESNGKPYLPEEDNKGDEGYEFGLDPVKNMP